MPFRKGRFDFTIDCQVTTRPRRSTATLSRWRRSPRERGLAVGVALGRCRNDFD